MTRAVNLLINDFQHLDEVTVLKREENEKH
jgi:hypothetical protein